MYITLSCTHIKPDAVRTVVWCKQIALEAMFGHVVVGDLAELGQRADSWRRDTKQYVLSSY